ncbi:hypothetical protein [Limnoglobus roseus]|uniref:Uncharacterized protein n=1 Tax=Limnoglobus roseus TaxID=2598579 RepID=A0A5C1AHB6_9BACT|nr:hypothetical protein [Limnoglobus roseus]QEL17557.1 hypothetical protein PX52LOC_04551 [Limnoglobus roseus]
MRRQHHDRRIDTAQLNDLVRRFGTEALSLPVMGSKHLRAILDREGVALHPRALGELRHMLQLERVKQVITDARGKR